MRKLSMLGVAIILGAGLVAAQEGTGTPGRTSKTKVDNQHKATGGKKGAIDTEAAKQPGAASNYNEAQQKNGTKTATTKTTSKTTSKTAAGKKQTAPDKQ